MINQMLTLSIVVQKNIFTGINLQFVMCQIKDT